MISCTSSVVSASKPQPKEFSCTRSRSVRCVTTLCRVVQTGVEHPLVVHAQVALQVAQVRDGILGEHGHAKARDELGDGVVYLVVDVVGTPCQDDAVGVVLLDPLEGLLALRTHLVLEVEINLPRAVDGVVDFLLRRVRELGMLLLALLDQVLVQALLEGFLVVVGDERVEEVRAARAQLVDVELERLGIAHDDRAVVVVVRARVLLALPADARHPDEVYVALEQVHDVTVRELGRVARVFGRHRLDARLEGRLRGRLGQLDTVAELREEACARTGSSRTC